MMIINLRDYYSFYSQDMFVEVSNDVAAQLVAFERNESAFRRKRARHRAFYSLDRNDGIECLSELVSITPEEYLEHKTNNEELHIALGKLSDKQASRIYAHFILGISQAEIARKEGVSRKAINLSISHGLQRLKYYLKK